MIRKYAEFFCWKNVSSFCTAKATHIFSAKYIRILYIKSAKTVNEMTLNEFVKLTTLWTTEPCYLVTYRTKSPLEQNAQFQWTLCEGPNLFSGCCTSQYQDNFWITQKLISSMVSDLHSNLFLLGIQFTCLIVNCTIVQIIYHFLWNHRARCCIFENGVLLMYTLEGVSSVVYFITTYEESQ